MKKIISIMIICLVIVLFPQSIFANDGGTYKISSIADIKNIYNDLEGTYEILNDIDLNGEVLKPIGNEANPFKGKIICNEHILSNFIIEDNNNPNLGFIGVNEGDIEKLYLDNVQIRTSSNTKNVGIFVGINKGQVFRCDGRATVYLNDLNNELNIGSLAGTNIGNLRNTIGELNYDKPINIEIKMNIGGLTGYNKSGSVRDCDTYGDIVVENGNNKIVGLLVGRNENGDIKRCSFMGVNNTVESELYEKPVGQTIGNVSTSSLLIRQNGIDDVSPEARELRNIVVDYMYQLGAILWTTTQQIQTSCVQKCSSESCHTPLNEGTTYRGLPYKHSSSTLDRMQYCLDENNSLKQWVINLGPLGGFQTYFGSACYSSVQLAWARVSNTINATCAMEALLHGEKTGAIGIGNWSTAWKYKLNDQYSQKCIDLVGIDAILEDYALVRAGDAFIKLNSSGAHAIMAASDVVVVRDENGKIDPDHSYLYTHEQGGPNNAPDNIVSSWCLDRYKTFSTLLGEAYLPVTIKELQEGKREDVQIDLFDGCDGILGLTTGIVYSNYYIDAVTLDIKENGNDFFNKKVYCRVDNIKDYGGTVAMFDRNFVKEYDLALLTKSIQDLRFNKNKTYHATLTVLLQTGDEKIIKEYDF